ncbi:hypothetical protein [Bradyrhizobium sp. WYCCWR 12699]|nr:hypothetical protein [Bradyrhizobium sp. WYCCWR 12699]MDT4738435.1 hypothetical protein [Bradyrhizobium sp. WYCCWR 12699]
MLRPAVGVARVSVPRLHAHLKRWFDLVKGRQGVVRGRRAFIEP